MEPDSVPVGDSELTRVIPAEGKPELAAASMPVPDAAAQPVSEQTVPAVDES